MNYKYIKHINELQIYQAHMYAYICMYILKIPLDNILLFIQITQFII